MYLLIKILAQLRRLPWMSRHLVAMPLTMIITTFWDALSRHFLQNTIHSICSQIWYEHRTRAMASSSRTSSLAPTKVPFWHSHRGLLVANGARARCVTLNARVRCPLQDAQWTQTKKCIGRGASNRSNYRNRRNGVSLDTIGVRSQTYL